MISCMVSGHLGAQGRRTECSRPAWVMQQEHEGTQSYSSVAEDSALELTSDLWVQTAPII